MLLKNNLYVAANIALGYIIDIHSSKYLTAKARISTMQGNYLDATSALDELLQKN